MHNLESHLFAFWAAPWLENEAFVFAVSRLAVLRGGCNKPSCRCRESHPAREMCLAFPGLAHITPTASLAKGYHTVFQIQSANRVASSREAGIKIAGYLSS